MKWSSRLGWLLGAFLALLVLRGAALGWSLAFLRVPLGLLAHLTAPVYDLVHYPHLRAENDSLRHTVATLTQQLLDTQALQAENARLRGLVELRESRPTPRLLAARVIARDPTQWTRAVVIDKGQRHGLAVGTPVVSAAGVVGKVVEVFPSTSFVLLVTDPEVRLGAAVSRTRDQGVAVGDGGWRIRVLYLSATSEAVAGDEVVTSGLGGVFPQGLRVGRIVTVSVDPSALYRVALVEPTAPLGQLEDVGCLVSP